MSPFRFRFPPIVGLSVSMDDPTPPPMSQLASLPISQPMSRIMSRISLTSDPGPIPSSSTFVNILQEGIDAYESQTGESVSKYLGSMTDYHTPDGFRRRIRAQARDLTTSTQLQRLDFLLINKWSFFFTPTRATRESKSYIMGFFNRVESFITRLDLYTKIPLTPEMVEIATLIMAEILFGLVLVNKPNTQGRFGASVKRLIGRNAFEEMLQRLDALTTKESQMMVGQTLKVVYGLVTGTKRVINDLNNLRGQTQDPIQRTEVNVNVERIQLRHDVQRWISAPDPWINHNNAIKNRHSGTVTWFTQGETFNRWKSIGSVLWIYGRPGSGKTVFCSSIIQDMWSTCQTGSAILAFFYFNHQDTAKLDARSLLSSLLIQLSNQSDRFHETLSTIYKAHAHGSRQPSEDELMQCLRDMINQGESPVYIIIDALDECPDSTGLASPRAEVLKIFRELIDISLWKPVHLCITSRPEVDIRRVFGRSTHYTVSLDENGGHRGDIAEYIKSVVHSEREWPEEDKELVINTLTQDCGGIFRWASCQLEVLRHTPLQSIRRALRKFPNALSETYERALRVINEMEREYAYRIFQFLAVSSRPLRVEELAEIFTIKVDAKSTGIPEFDARWRPEDAEDAVLSACCSLVAVVQFRDERFVRFSHFSVRQFLTSDRISNLKDVSYFHVLVEPAHMFLARVCLSLLLNEPNEAGAAHDSPLHSYAAKHWVDHARFGNVSSIIQEEMERLFDKDRPHFTAWITAYDLDRPQESPQTHFAAAAPLYYAALCGFYDLTKHLLATHPQDLNARGGLRATPLHAALGHGHVNVAKLLLQHDADVNALDDDDQTPLHLAAECGDPDILRSLIERGANPIAQNKDQETPLFLASRMGRLGAARVLSEHSKDEHGNDIQYQDSRGRTPLHVAAENGHYDIACLLLDRGADVDVPETNHRTPLHLAADQGKLAIAELLLERGAEVDACDKMKWTALHFASQQGHLELVQLLLEYDADALARNQEDHTFLDVAWESGHKEIINLQNEDGQTTLHIASQHGDLQLMRWLIKHDVKPTAEDERKETPLFPASRNGKVEAAELLLDAGAKVNHRNWQKMTPLHGASENGHDAVTKLLIVRKAEVDARHVYNWTPLHLASRTGKDRVAEALLDGDADVDAKNDAFWTPLHMASQKGHLDVVKLLLARHADVNARKSDGETPLHLAAFYGHFKVVQALLEKDPDLGVENMKGEIPQALALKEGHHNIAPLLEPTTVVREGGEEVHHDVAPLLEPTAPIREKVRQLVVE